MNILERKVISKFKELMDVKGYVEKGSSCENCYYHRTYTNLDNVKTDMCDSHAFSKGESCRRCPPYRICIHWAISVRKMKRDPNSNRSLKRRAWLSE